ncbi:MAG: D-alanine--D-alanine ligase family protein [Microthrixaceae bacterium]
MDTDQPATPNPTANPGDTTNPPAATPLARTQRLELPARVRLVVLFGGQSAEHDVSRTTAQNVLGALNSDRYEVRLVGISRTGRWLEVQGAADILGAAGAAEAVAAGKLAVAGPQSTLLSEISERAADDLPMVVLPLLHGPNGEDGTVQGLLELSGLPYVGSGVLGSAVSMDKAVAKELCAHAGLPQADWLTFHERDLGDDALADAIARLGLPIFVKPANLGSSVGISKVTDTDGLRAACAEALAHDETVVLEESVTGREIEIGVLGNEEPQLSVPGEIVAGAEFYDYEDKYVTGAAQLVIPAPLPDGVTMELNDLARRAFRTLRGADLARVDFFYEAEGRGLLLNEMNTLPGFTPASMYPRLWEASGLPYGDLIDELVRLALERHAHRGARRR